MARLLEQLRQVRNQRALATARLAADHDERHARFPAAACLAEIKSGCQRCVSPLLVLTHADNTYVQDLDICNDVCCQADLEQVTCRTCRSCAHSAGPVAPPRSCRSPCDRSLYMMTHIGHQLILLACCRMLDLCTDSAALSGLADCL